MCESRLLSGTGISLGSWPATLRMLQRRAKAPPAQFASYARGRCLQRCRSCLLSCLAVPAHLASAPASTKNSMTAETEYGYPPVHINSCRIVLPATSCKESQRHGRRLVPCLDTHM